MPEKLFPLIKKGKPADVPIEQVFLLLDARPDMFSLTGNHQREGNLIKDNNGNVVLKKVVLDTKGNKIVLPFGLQLDGNNIVTDTGKIIADLFQLYGRHQTQPIDKVLFEEKATDKIVPAADSGSTEVKIPPASSENKPDENVERKKLEGLSNPALDTYAKTALKIDTTGLKTKKEKIDFILEAVAKSKA